MNLPNIDEKAPDFELQDQNGNMVRLSDFCGQKHVVLYFYPKAMTPGCTTQACGIRDSEEALATADIEVLGVSPDAYERLKKFEDKQSLNFTLLSDPEHELCETYGVWGLKKFMGREYMGVNRMSFLIDKDGVLRHIMKKVKTKTHHQDVIDYIRDHF